MKENSFRILTLNCHEAWVYQLGYLGNEFDIVDGLPGRYCSKWDTGVRPIPERSRLVVLDKVLKSRPSYCCIVTHNLTDLLTLKSLPAPRILVFHNTLEGRVRQHDFKLPPDRLRELAHNYLDLVGGHAIAISALKGKSWGFSEDIVETAVDVNDYPSWSGEIAAGIRVSNQIMDRNEILLWELHEAAFKDIDIRLVGFNPDIPGVVPSRDWNHLKTLLSSHRFFVHTAHPELEDGYNMATLEAMAAGLPILGNRHHSSPIEHGVSGFLSDDPRELKYYAQLLLRDKNLAGSMGATARKVVAEKFPMKKFVNKFKKSIEISCKKWQMRKVSDSYFSLETSGKDVELILLVNSGRFFQHGESFRDYVDCGDIERAVGVLDEIMKLLGMPRDKCVSGLNDLNKVIIDVGKRLIGLQDIKTAELLLKTTLKLVTNKAKA